MAELANQWLAGHLGDDLMRWSHTMCGSCSSKTLPDKVTDWARSTDEPRRRRGTADPGIGASTADAAQVSELGTGTPPSRYPPPGYYPPPLPPGAPVPRAPYPSPSYPGLEPKPSRGIRVGWIMFAVIVLGLVLRGVGIVANQFASHNTVSDHPTSKPGVSGGGGSFITLRPTTHTSAPSEASPRRPHHPRTPNRHRPRTAPSAWPEWGQNRIFTCKDSGDGQWCEQYRCPCRSLRSRRRVGRREHSHRGQCGQSSPPACTTGSHSTPVTEVSQSGISNNIDRG